MERTGRQAVRAMLLELRDIEVRYQKVAALKGVSMAVPAGGIVTIIGANGAGKTTTLRAISGLEPLTRAKSISTMNASMAWRRKRSCAAASPMSRKGGGCFRI